MNGRHEHASASIPALLVLNGATGKSVIISSQEGANRNPPCIRIHKSKFSAAKQQWYADDGSTAGYFAGIRAQCQRLQQLGPNNRYFPESSTSILVVVPHNVEQAKVEFAGLNFEAS